MIKRNREYRILNKLNDFTLKIIDYVLYLYISSTCTVRIFYTHSTYVRVQYSKKYCIRVLVYSHIHKNTSKHSTVRV